MQEYNNKIINGQLLTLNWARKNYNNNNIKNNRNDIITNYYTVNYIFF